MLSTDQIVERVICDPCIKQVLYVSDPKKRLDVAFAFVCAEDYKVCGALHDPTRAPDRADFSARAQGWHLLRERTVLALMRIFR